MGGRDGLDGYTAVCMARVLTMTLTYKSVDTDNGRVTVRAADGRSTFVALVLERSAGGRLMTVVRMDGQGTGNPFVIDARQVVAQ